MAQQENKTAEDQHFTTTEKPESIDDIINAHWIYIKALLQQHNISSEHLKIAEFHYKTAFKHGWKHAMEDFSKPRMSIDLKSFMRSSEKLPFNHD